MFSKHFYICLILAALGCNRLPYTAKVGGQLNTLDSSWKESSKRIDNLIQPYKAQIDSQMNIVVGYSAEELIKSRPESALGNGITDLLISYGTSHINDNIDLCVLNYGGLRAPLPKGPIVVGRIYEIMPFDNTLVVITLSTEELKSLARHILTKSGEPIGAKRHVKIMNYKSGAIFQFEEDSLNAKKSYNILTSNYLADGGDGYTVFQSKPRFNSNILIRTALIAEFSKTTQKEPFKAVIDGRIVWDPNNE